LLFALQKMGAYSALSGEKLRLLLAVSDMLCVMLYNMSTI